MKMKLWFQMFLDAIYHFDHRGFVKSIVDFHHQIFDWNTTMGSCNLLIFIIGAFLGITITFAVSIYYLSWTVALVLTVLSVPICGWALVLFWWLFALIGMLIYSAYQNYMNPSPVKIKNKSQDQGEDFTDDVDTEPIDMEAIAKRMKTNL